MQARFRSSSGIRASKLSGMITFAHQHWAGELCRLLGKAPELPAAAEVVIRHCYFHFNDDLARDSRQGFCLTVYCTGYGDEEEEAYQRWGITLRLMQNAMAQMEKSASAP